jgi:hypothetical protein
MEIGIFHKVVEYCVVQKITQLRVNRYLFHPQVKTFYNFISGNPRKIHKKQKRSPATDERCLPSNELFVAIRGRKPIMIFLKVL